MRKKAEEEFFKEIRSAVQCGWLNEPFRANDVRKAVPGYANRTYNVFLPKHRVGNLGNETELFIRIDRGLYRLKI